MKTLEAAAAYFALVFGAGFVLGTLRVLLLVPLLGERAAELAETPLMLMVVLVAARFVVARVREPRPAVLARIGLGALALLLLAEAGVVVFVRGESIADYAAARDPVSGTVYLLALGWFAAAPALVGRRRPRAGADRGERD